MFEKFNNDLKQILDAIKKNDGNFLVKNFQGEDTEKLFKFVKTYFDKTQYIKPAASDKKSKEIYILGLLKK